MKQKVMQPEANNKALLVLSNAQEKLVDYKACSRRLVGLPEKVEGSNPSEFLASFLWT